MKILTLFLSLCTLLALCSSHGHAAVYFIDEFTQCNGTNTFIDPFSDGDEPPFGPLSSSDYIVFGSFGTDRENDGLLELNSSDGSPQGGVLELVCAVGDRSFFFSAGSGGSLTGVFEINDGFSVNSDFGLGIDNFQTDDLPPGGQTESANIGVFVGSDGSVLAFWSYGIDGKCNDNLQDITSEFGANTRITLELLVNDSDQVTARWDYGSDGFFDLEKCDFATLDFIAGTYTGSFAMEVVCTGDVNGDSVVNVLDLIDLLLCFGQPAIADCEPADFNEDGTVNVLDLIDLLLQFGQACP